MIRQDLAELFARDLTAVKNEIAAYERESAIWLVGRDVTNSAGNLCLHLIGNINHFFGALIARNGFVRDRGSEFSSKFVPRDAMLQAIDGAIEVMRGALDGLSDDDLNAPFPEPHRGRAVTMRQMLLHLLTHLNYHLGQINYHRRLSEDLVIPRSAD